MQPVACARCGTTVLVSKFSAEQTSIQWQVASDVCPLRAELTVGETCPALSDSIRDAVLQGVVGVSTRDE
jgi:bifunctional pyridoxal-dependent enzyme with beta-cystathionase and maltose regulon repressor activities